MVRRRVRCEGRLGGQAYGSTLEAGADDGAWRAEGLDEVDQSVAT